MATMDKTGDVLVSQSIGRTRHLTPDGFLYCESVRIASTKPLLYRADEMRHVESQHGMVLMDRPPEVLFSEDTLASFQGKPITNAHPSTLVSPKTWKAAAVGTVLNPRRGTGIDKDYLIADLLITDETSIRDIQMGKVEVSCGYDQDHEQIRTGHGQFTRITGNHVALVDKGRCGPACAIGDKSHEEGEHWITVHPNGPDEEGQPVLLNSNGIVKGGLGGKFKDKHISEVHGKVGRSNSRTSSHEAFGEAPEPHEGFKSEYGEGEGEWTTPELSKKELRLMRRVHGLTEFSEKEQKERTHNKRREELKKTFKETVEPSLNDPVTGEIPKMAYSGAVGLPENMKQMLHKYGFVPREKTLNKISKTLGVGDKMMNVFERLRGAFRHNDTEAFDAELKAAEKAFKDAGQRVIVEVNGDVHDAGVKAVADELAEDGDLPLTVVKMLGQLQASMDALSARMDGFEKKGPPKDEDEEDKKKKEKEACDEALKAEEAKRIADEALKAEEEKKAADVALDSMSLAVLRLDFQDTVTKAEILAPGIRLPAFDGVSQSKKTIADSMCGLRKAALDVAMKDPKNGAFVTKVIGKDADLDKMTCDALTLAFNASAELARQAANAPKPSFDERLFAQGPMTAARLQEINKANRANA